jgi:hypothetical protein
MQKVEYAIVTMAPKAFGGTQVGITWPDGNETRFEKSIVVVLNEMAVEGWEVVTSAGTQYVVHWTLRRTL